MLNQLVSPWSDEISPETPGWDTDRNPRIRLSLLWLGMFLPILVVCGRVAQLQLALQDDFARGFSSTTSSLEEIPARDGRILATDGSVLADDVRQYDISIHYPALVYPPDDEWIAGKAKSRLSKSDRRNASRLAAEKQKVLDELTAFWTRLSVLTERSVEDLDEARQQVQTRVEGMKASVIRRHHEREAAKALENAAENENQTFWSVISRQILQKVEDRRDHQRGPRLIAEETAYHTVITNVTQDMVEEIKAHGELYPHAEIVVRTKRVYPHGELASHLIGYRKPITEEQLQARQKKYPEGDPQDYRLGDPCGLDGLERSYDAVIKGIRGRRTLIKNRRGEILETRVDREPQHGRDLILTIDASMQRKAEALTDEAMSQVTIPGTVDQELEHGAFRRATRPRGACLVAMDVNTGAIIAAASAPRFDLNLMVSSNAEAWKDLVADPRSPLMSRITRIPLPPGSVFKPISAVASIESGVMHAETLFDCRGYLDNPRQFRCLPFVHRQVGHGSLDLAGALCRSCNVYFYSAARRMGPQTLVDWAREFGIGEPTGIDLPSESAGYLPAPDQVASSSSKAPKWKPVDTLQLAIGQSTLEVTPLQMLRMIAAFANDGYLVRPHLAANSGPSSMDESDAVRQSLTAEGSRPVRGLHPGTLEAVREGLVMVVHDSHGTGYKTVRLKEISIAGKTGTAQTNGVDHAWFAGYAPAERPRFAFVVVIQNGGGGGKVAGPVAREFVKALLEANLLSKPAALASDLTRAND